MIRALLIALLFIPSVAQAYSCKTIRLYVAKYGEEATINWALSHGYSQAQIEKVKRDCLK